MVSLIGRAVVLFAVHGLLAVPVNHYNSWSVARDRAQTDRNMFGLTETVMMTLQRIDKFLQYQGQCKGCVTTANCRRQPSEHSRAVCEMLCIQVLRRLTLKLTGATDNT